jgi:hypothetical protein
LAPAVWWVIDADILDRLLEENQRRHAAETLANGTVSSRRRRPRGSAAVAGQAAMFEEGA